MSAPATGGAPASAGSTPAQQPATDSFAKRFAERNGLNRPMVRFAAMGVGLVLVWGMWTMNGRIQERKMAAAADSDAAAVDTSALGEDAPQERTRAAWNDPAEAARLAGDTVNTLPAELQSAVQNDSVPAGSDYVPVGSGGEVGPGGYAATSRGANPQSGGAADGAQAELGDAPAGGNGYGAAGQPEREMTPDEQRRAHYMQALTSRAVSVRRGRREGQARGVDGSPSRNDVEAGGGETVLRPYGPEEQAEDEAAARRSSDSLVVRPISWSGTSVGYQALYVRPCGRGERILGAGQVISAILVSEIDSELSGPILARTSRDLYDPAQRCVVVPAGSLLIGSTGSAMAMGGNRLSVVWERVRLADGRTYALPKLPTASRSGAPGVGGRVDRRTADALRQAAVLGAISAAIEYATPQSSEGAVVAPGGYPVQPSRRDRAVGAATEPFREMASQLLERNGALTPILRVRAGAPVTVLVQQDVDLDAPPPPPPPAQGDTTRRVPSDSVAAPAAPGA